MHVDASLAGFVRRYYCHPPVIGDANGSGSDMHTSPQSFEWSLNSHGSTMSSQCNFGSCERVRLREDGFLDFFSPSTPSGHLDGKRCSVLIGESRPAYIGRREQSRGQGGEKLPSRWL